MKVTLEQLEALIAHEHYTRVPETTVTICAVTLHSGFTVIGKSACIDPADFDDALGREYSRKDAVDQLWELEGYARLSKALV